MLFLVFFFFLLLLSSTTTFAKPTKQAIQQRCQSPVENTPWMLNDIELFEATADDDTNTPSTFSFSFYDLNAGLEFYTPCHGRVVDGNCQAGEGGYVFCTNKTVQFQLLDRSTVLIARAYEDDCEPFPYNGYIAFGRNTLTPTSTQTERGNFSTQTFLWVPITSLA